MKGRRAASWRRLALVAGVVGLVALLGAGAGGYAVARNSELGAQTARCGGGRCIPGLSPAMLTDALTQKGFTCEERGHGVSTCELGIAGAEFTTYVDSHENLITNLSGSVRSDYGDKVPATTRSFLTWLGSIPVSHDPVTVGEVRGWLDQRLDGGESAKATIGAYRYELTAAGKESLRLRVWVGQG
ncbi:hypothetical protein ACGFIR_14495 [Micromonospora sp. NPDC049051]|uniref:hypothetical protein n=1 Tax=unclassified Micromonospora TaxID=2617518 RepID=UPI00371BC3E0